MRKCGTYSNDPDVCLGVSLMARISFILALFHIFIFLITLARNEIAASFHDGCWGTKFLLVAGGYIGSLWISNDFMLGFYMDFTQYVGMFFLIYQALLMLIVAYKVNDTLVGNY